MLMLSPNPFSLFCALLLCLPLALFFSLSSDNTLSIPHLHLHPHPHHVPASTFLSPPPPPPPSPLKNTIARRVHPTLPKIPFPSPPPPPPPYRHRKKPPKKPASNKINSTRRRIPFSTPQPPPPPPNKHPKTPFENNRNSTSPKLSFSPPPSPPPPVPEDDKDDVELLKRASWANPDPLGGPKKVAFLFLTTTPLPFAPIWDKFFTQNNPASRTLYNIYIHTNPKPDGNPDSEFSGVFKNRVIPILKPTARNTPTLVSAARRLLAHALLDDPNNYMFTLLSAACIPLHSFNFTYATLTSSTKSFIEILDNETTAYSRWAARGEDQMLPEVPLDLFRIGSQFWTLTRRHARLVVSDVNLWRKFRVPCVDPDVCYPEENYFPTLLSMADPDGVVPATLTNVNWEGSYDGHPRTYNETEVGEGLIRWLREARPRYGQIGGMKINESDFYSRWDPFLFARKFAPPCLPPLFNLTNDLLFKD